MLHSWVNTDVQVLDFLFELNVPIHADNAYQLAGTYLYDQYNDYSENSTWSEQSTWFEVLNSNEEPGEYEDYYLAMHYDYDDYMAEIEEWSKYEIYFKCVKGKEQEYSTVTIPYWEWTATATEQPIINSFYVNGLDQEYLTFLSKYLIKKVHNEIKVFCKLGV